MSDIYVPTHTIYNCDTKTESLKERKKISKRENGETQKLVAHSNNEAPLGRIG